MVAAPDRRRLIVRGVFSKLWRAFDEPGSLPDEVAIWGAAGTSKSWQILQWLVYGVCKRFPNVPGRILICRDTYSSLTRSACVTMRKIVPPGDPLFGNVADEHRTEYRIGKWTIVLSGLSEPSRLYSTEWDIVFVEEGREISLTTWEEFSRGSRNYALYNYAADGTLARDEQGNLLDPNVPSAIDYPFSLTILATNPDARTHWIYRRAMQDGSPLAFWQAVRQDNPAYYDEHGRILPKGVAFDRRMERTTGVRYKRLQLAQWCTAEGAIWPDWDPDIHVLRGVKRDENGWIPKAELDRLGIVEFYLGADLGYDDAGVVLVGGLTRGGKLIIVAEVYHSRQPIAWWKQWLVAIHQHYPLTLGFVDHNRPDWIKEWNDAIGAPEEGPGCIFMRAEKGVDRGLEIVRARMGKTAQSTTLQFVHDCLMHPVDPELLERHLPWRTVDCIPEYVYQRGSYSDDEEDDGSTRPDKPNNKKGNAHGPDALRYLCVGVAYMHPDDLDIPLNEGYRRKLAMTGRPRFAGRFGDEDDDEYREISEEDEIIDMIRRACNGD